MRILPRLFLGINHRLQRSFHSTSQFGKIKPFLLPDIGEGKVPSLSLSLISDAYWFFPSLGIKEVQIIQWFVEPEARVEQFDKLCEVQSDKAAAEVWDAAYRLGRGKKGLR